MVSAWPFEKGDRIADKATGKFTGTVVAREDGGTYTVDHDTPGMGVEHGCKADRMIKIK